MHRPLFSIAILLCLATAGTGCRSWGKKQTFADNPPAEQNNPLRTRQDDSRTQIADARSRGTSIPAADDEKSQSLRRIEDLMRSRPGEYPPRDREEILANLRDSRPADVVSYLKVLESLTATGSARSESPEDDWEDGFRREGLAGSNGPERSNGSRLDDVSSVGHSRPLENADRHRDRNPADRSSPAKEYGSDPGVSGFRGNGGVDGGRPAGDEPRRRGEDRSRFGSGFSIPGLSFTGRNRGESREPSDRQIDEPTPGESPTAEWDRSLRRLLAIADMQAEASGGRQQSPKELPSHIRHHVHRRLLQLLSGDHHSAMDAIPGIETADQEFWQHTMHGLSASLRSDQDGTFHKGLRAAETVDHFRTAIGKLREQADLEIRHLNFCTKISSYGNYETVPLTKGQDGEESLMFRPGEQVLIYAEIENFKSELTSDGQYRTRLKSTVEVYVDAPGAARVGEPYDFDPSVDLCRNLRRDYFHSYIINLPANLGLGNYKLKLTVQDTLGGKVATDTIRFKVN